MPPRVYCQNSIRWSALRRACAACSPSATPCVPKITSVHCSGLCLKRAPRLKCASFGCSTCEAYWASCWRVSTSAWPKCCETRACSLWDTRCWALPAVRWADQATALPSRLWPRVTVVAMPRATGTPVDTVGLPGTTAAAWVRLPGGRAIPSSPPWRQRRRKPF